MRTTASAGTSFYSKENTKVSIKGPQCPLQEENKAGQSMKASHPGAQTNCDKRISCSSNTTSETFP